MNHRDFFFSILFTSNGNHLLAVEGLGSGVFSLKEKQKNKRMRRSKENNPGFAAPNDGLRMGGAKMVKDMEQNQRRALSSINQNIIGASLHHSGVVNKRELPGYFQLSKFQAPLLQKDEFCNKKSALEQRSDTRSLAVERVSNQHHFLEVLSILTTYCGNFMISIKLFVKQLQITDTKNQSELTVKPGGLDDFEIIDVEQCGEGYDVTLPMFVKHTEAVLDETDEMAKQHDYYIIFVLNNI
ncbi:G2/mitotic-specific cyclin-2-like isoform X2 [Gossypium australe]|uniref:G2/mitotic-specific cyclin-2-like isoform X2 n=1 Tax=Gossypium australe TaxID=47621 RepID=A0A5B6V936_9ROSI|nr:G2/mitotic-specific cyclin-2-like isoform X2 [Gossypium australe]